MFETLWSAFAQTGVAEKPCWTYAETYFGGLDEEEQSRLRMLVSDTPTLTASIKSESVDALARIGVAPSPINLGLASKLVMGARAAAAEACRLGSPRVDLTNTCLSEADAGGHPVFGLKPTSEAVTPARNPVAISKDHSAELEVPEPWCLLTPTQVAERFIADTPKMFEHRQSGKRASEQTGEQTLRQIRWAALLLEKSLPTGTPF